MKALAALVVLAVALSFFFALGRYPLFDVDEGAFSQATLEMLKGGDFVSTTLNGAPRYDKPILMYWMQAASVAALGVNEWAFRLPSALCAALWSYFVFAFTRRYYGTLTALVATVTMASCIAVCIVARMATADALLNMLIAASMLCAWNFLHTQRRRWLYASFAAAALGTLAKGPIAVLIPLAVTLVFCLLRRDFKTWLRASFAPAGLAVFALIALPWYVLTIYRDGWGFAQGFFMTHNIGRFTSAMQGHSGNAAYYVPVLLVATLPFTASIGRVCMRVRGVWRDDLQLFLLLWFAFVFVFFSIAATKLPHYLVYGLTGLFIVMAASARKTDSHFWNLLPALLLFVALFALPMFFEWSAPRVSDMYYRGALGEASESFGHWYFAVTGSAIVITAWLMLEPGLELPVKVAAVGIASVVCVGCFVLPVVASALQEPVKQAGLQARTQGYKVVMWGINTPSFSVYYGQPTPNRKPLPGEVVLTKGERLLELGMPFEQLYARGGIVLARVF